MTPDDLKALRKDLNCTARDLANTIGVDQETVLAWERGELFPTKKFVDAMEALRSRGPSAIVKRPKRKATVMELLADPGMWALIRKILAHDELRKELGRLAEKYPDPKDEAG